MLPAISHRLSLVCLITAGFLLAPIAAHAACSTPTGTAGDQIYNSTYNIMQYCNGTNWINMGGVNSSSTASGSTGYVQFNTSNVLDSESALFWDKSNNRLGIGTASPGVALDVIGTILSRVNNAGSSTSIDWSTANVAYTSANCAAMTFTNMQDGGSYTLIVTGATAATCSFSQSGLTFKLPVGHGATTVSKHTVYSFVRAGSNVYVTWVPGF